MQLFNNNMNLHMVFAFIAALCALGYLSNGVLKPSTDFSRTIKTMSVALLSLTVLTFSGPWLLALGLALCAAGDFYLARDDVSGFKAGMGLFAVGHMLYILLFVSTGGGFDALLAHWPAVVALLVVSAFAIVKMRPGLGELEVPVTAYVVVITLMGMAAFTLPLAGWSFIAVIGVIFFVISDFLIGHEKFVWAADAPQRAWSSIAVWVLYWCGQAMICFGVLFALN